MVTLRYLVIVLVVAVNVTAQNHSGHGGPPPGSIDGAKNPQGIPDDVAYEVFLHTVAVRPNATPAERAASRIKFSRAQFNDADRTAFESVLQTFYTKNLSLRDEIQ
jgi:hypothetical protein